MLCTAEYNLHPSQKSVLLLDYAVVCKSGKVFFGAVCNLVIPPPLKSGPLEVNKPSIDQLLLWPHRRNEDFQSQPNIWSSKLLLLYRLFEAEIIIVIVIRMVASYMDDGEIYQFLMVCILREGKYLISDSMCDNERKGLTLANYLHHDFFFRTLQFYSIWGREECLLYMYTGGISGSSPKGFGSLPYINTIPSTAERYNLIVSFYVHQEGSLCELKMN